MNIQGSAQHIDIMIDIITEKLNKNSYETESRTKPNQHRVENYTSSKQRILGFFSSSSTVSVSLAVHPANLGCFQSFRLAICSVPWNTHCSVASSSLRSSLPPFGNSNGFFQLPKKTRLKNGKNLFLPRWARSRLLWNKITRLVRVGDSFSCKHFPSEFPAAQADRIFIAGL